MYICICMYVFMYIHKWIYTKYNYTTEVLTSAFINHDVIGAVMCTHISMYIFLFLCICIHA